MTYIKSISILGALAMVLWTCKIRISENSLSADDGELILINCESLQGTIDPKKLKISLSKPNDNDFSIDGHVTRSVFGGIETYSIAFNRGPALSLSLYSFRVEGGKAMSASSLGMGTHGSGSVDYKCKG